MKRLVVNADDFGAGPRRNAGIVEAHRRGIVTSASILVNGEAFEDALRLIRETPALPVGLHLNLSEGSPLVAGHRTLADGHGRFFGKDESRRRALAGLFDPRELERETEAQIALLRERGVRPTHLDGHQHLHVYGPIAEPIARAAARSGLRIVRRPFDSLAHIAEPSRERARQVAAYGRLALEASEVYARHGMASPDAFVGAALTGLLTLEKLEAVVRSLPEGTTEFMVHPGYADAPAGFGGPEREDELRLLTDPRVRDLLVRERIALISFTDF